MIKYCVVIICSIFVVIGGKMYLKLKDKYNNEKNINNKEDGITIDNVEKVELNNYVEDKLNLNGKNDNKTMMQYFKWHYPNDGSLWNIIKEKSKELSDIGITSLWLPPAYKGSGGINDVGYGAYDLYDLGEFDQKGTIRTKYGTKKEYLDAINEAQKNGIEVYGDIVFNHKSGADESELVSVELVDSNDRNKIIEEKRNIKAFTVFNFPGRNDKYSSYKWSAKDFNGVDFDDITKKQGIFKFADKQWEQDVDTENGNYDFLMCADVDMNSNDVVNELKEWGKWYINQTKLDGVRLDAIKHIKFDFFSDWIKDIKIKNEKDLFVVGEYWSGDINKLKYYMEKSNNVMSLFDVPLHYKFQEASNLEDNFDMRTLLNNTLLEYDEKCSVTFVDNHDTEPGQSLESWVKPWFKLLAYTFILTRKEGYPCVFYGDYYGMPEKNFDGFSNELDCILKARKQYAYGIQHDYIDNKNTIGWTREGDLAHKNSGMVALITNGEEDSKNMFVGLKHAKAYFVDITGNIKERVSIDENGCGIFKVNKRSYSIWIKE